MAQDNAGLIIGALIAAVVGFFGVNYLVNRDNNQSQVNNKGNYKFSGSPSSCSKCPFS